VTLCFVTSVCIRVSDVFKVLFIFLDFDLTSKQLNFLNLITLMFCLLVGLITLFLLYLKKLTFIEFIFLLFSIYILATPTFPTYYLFSLYVFIILFLYDKNIYNNKYYILYLTIFMLVPKHYLSYLFSVPFESFLNPLILVISLLMILFGKFNNSYSSINNVR